MMTMQSVWIGDKMNLYRRRRKTSKEHKSDRVFIASRNRITFQFWPFIERSAEGIWGILALLFLGGGSLVVYYLCRAPG